MYLRNATHLTSFSSDPSSEVPFMISRKVNSQGIIFDFEPELEREVLLLSAQAVEAFDVFGALHVEHCLRLIAFMVKIFIGGANSSELFPKGRFRKLGSAASQGIARNCLDARRVEFP